MWSYQGREMERLFEARDGLLKENASNNMDVACGNCGDFEIN